MTTEHAWLRADDAWCFIEALGDLDGEEWLAAADRARQSDLARRLVADRLRVLVRQNGASLFAWWLNDGIDTQAWCCPRASSPLHSSRVTRAIRDARDAARVAALAVLLRPQLGEQQFRVLYEPFASAIPRAALSRPPDRTARLYGIFVRDGSGLRQRSRVASHTQP